MRLYTIEIVDKAGYHIYDMRVLAADEDEAYKFAASRLHSGEVIGMVY